VVPRPRGHAVTGSHAPSTRLGACDPCRAGDHAGCTDLGEVYEPFDDPCTCYDDSWEWHEAIAPNARSEP